MTQQIPQENAPKKGLSGWAWAGIGCGSVLLIGIVIFVLLIGMCKRAVTEFSNDMNANPERKSAEMIIGFHPDYSVVSSNDETKQMTIKEDKTGKEMTFSYQDIAEGKFAVTTSDGSAVSFGAVDLTKVPAWVVLPPDAKSTGGFLNVVNDKNAGVVVFTTGLTAEEVKEFFNKSWESWSTSSGSSSSMTLNGVETVTLERKSATQEISVMVQASGGKTTATVTYSEK
jgi:hypothetical protein